MQRFYIHRQDITQGRGIIKGQEAIHLTRVLRCRPGETVELLDGEGKSYLAKIETLSPREVTLDILKELFSSSESPIRITVAQGMLKDKKMDMLVRHLTELGITRWQPFFSERSIPKPDKKRIKKRVERWDTIARSAIKQCGRTRVPRISPPVRFNILMNICSTTDEKIAFWEKSQRPINHLQRKNRQPIQSIVLLIGPEGGLSETEIETAETAGFNAYSLGPRILRAETASITACALIQNLFGDLSTKKP